MRWSVVALLAFVVTAVVVTAPAGAQTQEKRFAFVVGNESYADGALPTAANDAGLVAQTLEAAGFDVVGARDLDAETLRQSYGDFLQRVTDAGKDAVAFVYLSGYGLQYGNDNYYVPIGATVSRAADIPIQSLRLSDLVGPLNALDIKARFMVFDMAYKLPFQPAGPPLAGGLSIIEPPPGSLVAYNTAPGTVAPVGKGNYGAYAQAFTAELREGGLPPDEIFDRTRLRVDAASAGAEVPWDASKIDSGFRFFDRGSDAPQVAAERKPADASPVQQAYVAALSRDTVRSYSEFTTTYSRDPLAKRARILLAARREAITWARTTAVDTPPAYWSYLARYPRGPHVEAARLRLAQLAASFEPPAGFAPIPYDVPPPPPDEIAFVDVPVLYLDDPAFDLGPPPPVDQWLPPVPVAFLDLPPPPPPEGLFFLPVPAFVPLAAYINPPPVVFLPTDNRFFAGDRDVRGGEIHRAFAAGARGPGGRTFAVALPAAAVQRAAAFEKRGITTPAALDAARRHPGGIEIAPGRARDLRPEQRLPGAGAGRPLPAAGAAPDAGRGGDRPGRGDADRRDRANDRGRDDRGDRDRRDRVDAPRDRGDRGDRRGAPREPHGGQGEPSRRNGGRNDARQENGAKTNGAKTNGEKTNGDRTNGPRGAGGDGRRGGSLREDGARRDGANRSDPGRLHDGAARPDRAPGAGREGPRGGGRAAPDRGEPAVVRGAREPGGGREGGGRPPGAAHGPERGGAGPGMGPGGPRGGPGPMMRPGGGPGMGGPHGPGMGGGPHGPGMGGGPHGGGPGGPGPGGGGPRGGGPGGPGGGGHGGGGPGGGPGRP